MGPSHAGRWRCGCLEGSAESRRRRGLTLALPGDDVLQEVDRHVVDGRHVRVGVEGQERVDLPLAPELRGELWRRHLNTRPELVGVHVDHIKDISLIKDLELLNGAQKTTTLYKDCESAVEERRRRF